MVSKSSTGSSPSSVAVSRIWGSFVGGSNQEITDFETLVGKKMNWVALFLSDKDNFPTQFNATIRDQGKTLLIFWEPRLTLDTILAGTTDEHLKKFAAAAKAYGGPVVFAPFHEMNGNWDEWNGTVGTNTPAKLIDSWKRVHGLFAGATNVKFGWAVNHESIPDTFINRIEAYYPGDAFVDYVGIDGFNWGDPWQSFDQVFRDSLQTLRAYNKPIYIFSTASMEGEKKAAWITDALVTQMNAHPEIKGWLWFNANKERDWRVNSDPNYLKAFQDAVR